MSTGKERVHTTRGTTGWKKALAGLATVGMTLALSLTGVVAMAPAAQACPIGCHEVTAHAPGGNGEFCSVTGETVELRWAGGSATMNYGENGRCQYTSEEDAMEAAQAAADAQALQHKTDVTKGYTADACVPPPEYACLNARARTPGGSGEYCNASGQNVVLEWAGGCGSATYGPVQVEEGLPLDEVTCDATTEEAARLIAQDEADARALANMQKATSGATPGMCTPPGLTYSATGAAGGSVDYCTVDGTTVVVDYTGTGAATSTVSQADANFVAQQKADAAAQADLAAKTPAGAKLGACVPVTVAPVEPGTVAQPVTEVAAATVAAPAAATLPAAVPAGDGSTAPQAPVWALALLALATVGAVASATRLSVRRNG